MLDRPSFQPGERPRQSESSVIPVVILTLQLLAGQGCAGVMGNRHTQDSSLYNVAAVRHENGETWAITYHKGGDDGGAIRYSKVATTTGLFFRQEWIDLDGNGQADQVRVVCSWRDEVGIPEATLIAPDMPDEMAIGFFEGIDVNFVCQSTAL